MWWSSVRNESGVTVVHWKYTACGLLSDTVLKPLAKRETSNGKMKELVNLGLCNDDDNFEGWEVAQSSRIALSRHHQHPLNATKTQSNPQFHKPLRIQTKAWSGDQYRCTLKVGKLSDRIRHIVTAMKHEAIFGARTPMTCACAASREEAALRGLSVTGQTKTDARKRRDIKKRCR